MVKLTLPRQLMNYTNLTDDFISEATTIEQALDDLVQSHPMLKAQIYNQDRTLRNFVSIFVNEEMADDLRMPVLPHSRIQIIIAVAGG
ncbi:MoaD/ThiS family protein [Yersinia enterocolitica]|uniref:MoaD/ThiS family protein n=1 Tax=Yersinia enterocolitica TaxID=630 RepID=UPI003D7967E3